MEIDINTIITGLLAGSGGGLAIAKLYVNSLIDSKIEKQRNKCEKLCKEHKDDAKEDLKEIKDNIKHICNELSEQKNLFIKMSNDRRMNK